MKNLYVYSKKLLKNTFSKCLKKQRTKAQKKYFKAKYKHAFHTSFLAQKIFSIKKEETILYLMHDVGRFLLPIENQQSHAKSGYIFLKKQSCFPVDVLLPILLHETDNDWEKTLNNLKSFRKLSVPEQQVVYLNTQRLKDADIIANMFERLSSYKTEEYVNEITIQCLLNNKICEKDFLGSINKAIYIICGVYLLSTPEGLSFIKQSGIIKKYFDKIVPKIKNKDLQSKLKACKQHLIKKGLI